MVYVLFYLFKAWKLLNSEALAHRFQMQASGPTLSSPTALLTSVHLTVIDGCPSLSCLPSPSFLLLLDLLTANSAGTSSSVHSLNITVSPTTLISDLLFSQSVLSPGWCHSLTRFKNLLYVDTWLPNLHPKYRPLFRYPKIHFNHQSYWPSKPSMYKHKPSFLPLCSLP